MNFPSADEDSDVHDDDDEQYIRIPSDSGESDMEDVLPLSNDDDDDDDQESGDEEFHGSDDDDYEAKKSFHGETSESENEEQKRLSLSDEAWGRKKSVYFSTDFVDEDRGRSYREEDKEAAKAEEEDALLIQRRHLQNLHSSAFETSAFFQKKESVSKDAFDVTLPEWKSINKSEKLQIIKKKWPEFMSVLKDFKNELSETSRCFKSSDLGSSLNTDPMYSRFLIAKNQVYLHYLMIASFYMHLRAQGKETLHHPVFNKIMVLKKLLSCFKKLSEKFMCLRKKDVKMKQQVKHKLKKPHIQIELQSRDLEARNNETDHKEISGSDEGEKAVAEQAKRSVSYQIVKNKGLTPYRRKEYRNPRVRQRMKYRKAEIRRKGQVKKPRREVSRYGGEFSGIHAYVTRSASKVFYLQNSAQTCNVTFILS